MKTLRITGLVAAAGLMAGCAIDSPESRSAMTGSIKPRSISHARSATKSSDDTRRSFCAQRHIDYQTGKAPGGAKTPDQKAADDRMCDALGRQS